LAAAGAGGGTISTGAASTTADAVGGAEYTAFAGLAAGFGRRGANCSAAEDAAGLLEDDEGSAVFFGACEAVNSGFETVGGAGFEPQPPSLLAVGALVACSDARDLALSDENFMPEKRDIVPPRVRGVCSG